MGLTDLQVKKLAPKKQRYEVLDSKGLYIRVMPTGGKSWVFRYQFEGIPRRMTFGAYPGNGLATARQKHGAALEDLQRGIDPGAVALAEKAKRKAAPTFKDLLDEFLEMELEKSPTGKERRRMVEKDALAPWGNRKVADITRRDAVVLLDKVRKRAPIGANRLQGVLVRMFNFAAERGIIEHSPLTGLRRPQEKARSRVLTDDEIKSMWKALGMENKDIDIYRVTKLALKLILLTGQRPGEVAGMAWAEIDEDAGFWNIPAGRMKNAEPQRVPLCPMAIEIIEQAKVYSDPDDCDFVFRSSYKPKEAVSRHALGKAIKRHWPDMKIAEKFTPHDLRRTLRTRLAELGVSDIVAERVLGHKLQGVMAVYNRHAYDQEKRQALMKWEAKLQKIIGVTQTPSNVIPFEVRHA